MLHFAGDFNEAFLSSRDSFTLCSRYRLIPCLVFVLMQLLPVWGPVLKFKGIIAIVPPSASYGGGGGVTDVFELCFIFHCYLKEIFNQIPVHKSWNVVADRLQSAGRLLGMTIPCIPLLQ